MDTCINCTYNGDLNFINKRMCYNLMDDILLECSPHDIIKNIAQRF